MRRFIPNIVSNDSSEVVIETSPPISRPLLVIGSRVHCTLYGGQDGIVFAIHGEQQPDTVEEIGCGVMVTGGSADFDIVFTGDHAHVSLRLPEALVRGGGQWEILPGVATNEEIDVAMSEAQTRKLTLEKAATQKAGERRTLSERHRQNHPWLKPVLPGSGTGGKHAAINIRIELKRAFPATKFSVRSDYNSVDITWDLGPTVKEVEVITGKYQEGHFNGMTDSYERDEDDAWTPVFGGAQYVNERRNIESVRKLVGQALCELQHVAFDENVKLLGASDPYWLGDHIHQLMARTSFAPGAVVKGVERVPWQKDSHDHHWCKIVFETPVVPVGAIENAQARFIETQHTKHKHPIFVVQLVNRVERAEYERFNALAKSLGGYYSSFRGNGAVPGFIFKVREPAEKFFASICESARPDPVSMETTTAPCPPIAISIPNPTPRAASWRSRVRS